MKVDFCILGWKSWKHTKLEHQKLFMPLVSGMDPYEDWVILAIILKYCFQVCSSTLIACPVHTLVPLSVSMFKCLSDTDDGACCSSSGFGP